MEIYIFFYKLICVIYGYVIFLYNLDLYWYVFESEGFIYFLDILRWFNLLICILEKVVVMKNFKFFIIFLIYFVRCILILIKICIFIVNIMENKLIK